MRVLICGGRDYQNKQYLFETLDALYAFEDCKWSTIIQGGAQGADTLAVLWARANNIPVQTFFAEWKKYGKMAGYLRNKRMLFEGRPDLIIAFPGGRGTANMIAQAQEARARVLQIIPETTDASK